MLRLAVFSEMLSHEVQEFHSMVVGGDIEM